jgi:hypothetical protein
LAHLLSDGIVKDSRHGLLSEITFQRTLEACKDRLCHERPCRIGNSKLAKRQLGSPGGQWDREPSVPITWTLGSGKLPGRNADVSNKVPILRTSTGSEACRVERLGNRQEYPAEGSRVPQVPGKAQGHSDHEGSSRFQTRVRCPGSMRCAVGVEVKSSCEGEDSQCSGRKKNQAF